MPERLTRSDLIWGYLAQVMNLAGGLLLLPILVLHLSPEEIGMWFVFLTMVSLAQILEQGLLPTLARYASYVYSGVDEINGEGLSKKIVDKKVNLTLLRRLVHAGRNAYRVAGIIVALILFCGGGIYISYLQNANNGLNHEALPAWLVYASGFVLSAYFGHYNAFIIGRGDIAQNNKIIIAAKGGFIIFGGLAIVSDFGLMGLGVASILSGLVGRIIARYYYYSGMHATEKEVKIKNTSKSLIILMLPNVLKLTIVQIGSFLIVRANTMVASIFMGLALVGSYGLTVQLLLAISGISTLLVSLQLPRMNAAQVRGDLAHLQRAVALAVVSSWVMFSTGAVILTCFGNLALELMGKNISLLDSAVMSVLIIVTFLEMNHSIAAMYLTTLNRVPFANAAIISGISIIFLSFLLCGLFNLGVWGLILSQGIVQLAYNNWKWPYETLKNLEITPSKLIRLGFVELRHMIRAK
jgi:O-antigen/teichoic acid export membrane protein